MDRLPLIDLRASPDEVALRIGQACRPHGFFYIINHGIEESLGQRLELLSHRFFALPESAKARCAMPLGGRAWRGWFPELRRELQRAPAAPCAADATIAQIRSGAP